MRYKLTASLADVGLNRVPGVEIAVYLIDRITGEELNGMRHPDTQDLIVVGDRAVTNDGGGASLDVIANDDLAGADSLYMLSIGGKNVGTFKMPQANVPLSSLPINLVGASDYTPPASDIPVYHGQNAIGKQIDRVYGSFSQGGTNRVFLRTESGSQFLYISAIGSGGGDDSEYISKIPLGTLLDVIDSAASFKDRIMRTTTTPSPVVLLGQAYYKIRVSFVSGSATFPPTPSSTFNIGDYTLINSTYVPPGERGAVGASGYSAAIVYRRSSGTLTATPSGGSASGGRLTAPPRSWGLDVPAGTDALWISFVLIQGDSVDSYSKPMKLGGGGVGTFDIQAIAVSSEAQLTTALTEQGTSDAGLIIDITVAGSFTASGTVYRFGDVLFVPPRSNAVERLFNKAGEDGDTFNLLTVNSGTQLTRQLTAHTLNNDAAIIQIIADFTTSRREYKEGQRYYVAPHHANELTMVLIAETNKRYLGRIDMKPSNIAKKEDLDGTYQVVLTDIDDEYLKSKGVDVLEVWFNAEAIHSESWTPKDTTLISAILDTSEETQIALTTQKIIPVLAVFRNGGDYVAQIGTYLTIGGKQEAGQVDFDDIKAGDNIEIDRSKAGEITISSTGGGEESGGVRVVYREVPLQNGVYTLQDGEESLHMEFNLVQGGNTYRFDMDILKEEIDSTPKSFVADSHNPDSFAKGKAIGADISRNGNAITISMNGWETSSVVVIAESYEGGGGKAELTVTQQIADINLVASPAGVYFSNVDDFAKKIKAIDVQISNPELLTGNVWVEGWVQGQRGLGRTKWSSSTSVLRMTFADSIASAIATGTINDSDIQCNLRFFDAASGGNEIERRDIFIPITNLNQDDVQIGGYLDIGASTVWTEYTITEDIEAGSHYQFLLRMGNTKNLVITAPFRGADYLFLATTNPSSPFPVGSSVRSQAEVLGIPAPRANADGARVFFVARPTDTKKMLVRVDDSHNIHRLMRLV